MNDLPPEPWCFVGEPTPPPEENTVNRIAPYWKAVVGFVAPAAVVITASVTEASVGGTAITTGEWITAVCAAVITSAGVYGKGNAA